MEFFKRKNLAGEVVNLPHTWNGIDGQDGGNDYYRGTCYYTKVLKKAKVSENVAFLQNKRNNKN